MRLTIISFIVQTIALLKVKEDTNSVWTTNITWDYRRQSGICMVPPALTVSLDKLKALLNPGMFLMADKLQAQESASSTQPWTQQMKSICSVGRVLWSSISHFSHTHRCMHKQVAGSSLIFKCNNDSLQPFSTCCVLGVVRSTSHALGHTAHLLCCCRTCGRRLYLVIAFVFTIVFDPHNTGMQALLCQLSNEKPRLRVVKQLVNNCWNWNLNPSLFNSKFFKKNFFSKLKKIEVYLIYNVVLVSGVQHSDSVIYIYPFSDAFP